MIRTRRKIRVYKQVESKDPSQDGATKEKGKVMIMDETQPQVQSQTIIHMGEPNQSSN